MKNVISIFIFFITNTYFLFSQVETESFTIPINDTSNSTINPIYFKLIKKGYLIPSIRVIKQDNHFLLEVSKGQKYSKIELLENNNKTSSYSPKELTTYLENRFNQLINNGFPFANIKIDSINFYNETIITNLNINKGPYFEWGEIILNGYNQISETFLRGILEIKKEEPFDEEKFISIENKIQQLPYLNSFRKPEILFENGKVNLYLYLESKPINNISGTIGIQQNTITQNYFLIGDFKLKLLNQLKKGEGLDVQWRRIQEGTQSLKIGLNYPSIFKSHFGLDNQFSLYKKDSTFIEIKNLVGIQYFSSKGFLIKANYKYIESNVLSTSNTNINYGKSTNYLSGLSLQKQKLDYIPAPTNGYAFIADLSFGKRHTSRSDSTKNKYDNTFKAEYQFIYYQPFYKKHIIKFQFSGDFYLAPYYYQNELLRFGGLLNQRGFREDELQANIRMTQSIEYRFMLEQNSFLFSYFDLTYFENHLNKTIYATPYGFGTGISFGTQQGIFSISYALGKLYNNPILLKNGIIHFGYISYF